MVSLVCLGWIHRSTLGEAGFARVQTYRDDDDYYLFLNYLNYYYYYY